MLSNTYKQKTRSYLKYALHQKTEYSECIFYDELKVCILLTKSDEFLPDVRREIRVTSHTKIS